MFSRENSDNSKVYLDNNATTQLIPEVWQAIENTIFTPLNPSSVHSFGRNARKIVEDSKAIIANCLNFDKNNYRVIFTGSGTEANNWILKNTEGVRFITLKTEHASVIASRDDFTYIDVDENGLINLNMLEDELAKGPKALVSVMMANNETGVIQDMLKIREITKRYGAILHSDLIQAAGKIPVDINLLDLDAFTISSHKIHGPSGVAALVVKRGIPVAPMIVGGGQNQGLRAGTENIMGIVGMAAAINIAVKNLNERSIKLIQMQKYLESKIINFPGAKIISQNASRLPNTSLIVMPNVGNETQLIAFDMAGIAISSGSACSSGKIATSHVLKAQNINENDAKCVVRCSTSAYNTLKDIEKFIEVWSEIYKKHTKN